MWGGFRGGGVRWSDLIATSSKSPRTPVSKGVGCVYVSMYVLISCGLVCDMSRGSVPPPQPNTPQHNPQHDTTHQNNSGHGPAAAHALPAVRGRGACYYVISSLGLSANPAWRGMPCFFVCVFFWGGCIKSITANPTTLTLAPTITILFLSLPFLQAMNDNEDMALAACQCLETLNTLVQVFIYLTGGI